MGTRGDKEMVYKVLEEDVYKRQAKEIIKMACRVYLYRIGASKADNQDGLPHLPVLNTDKQKK